VSLKQPARDPEDGDEAVVERVRRGDTAAFRILVDRHEAQVFRLVRGLVPTHVSAQDIAQDVFVSAFVGLARFDASRGQFSSWLLTIAKNRCLNVKKRRYALSAAEPSPQATHVSPADLLECTRTMQRLDRALLALPDEQRSTFVLGEFLGLSARQIAEIENCPPTTVRSRLSRAKAALLAALAESGEDS